MITTLFSFFVGAGFMPVDPPPASEWQLVSDRTERGGESTGAVANTDKGIEFSGTLGSIPGTDGEPVGFSLARIPIQVAPGAKGLRIRLESESDVVMQILIAPPLGQPALTYQREVTLGVGPQDLKIRWNEFRATIRGKPASGRLDTKAVTSFALQVTRSAQPGDQRYEPITFRIRMNRL